MIIERLIKQKKYGELIALVRKLWTRQGWLYLKRQKNAVQRIKQEFTRLTGNAPYQTEAFSQFWDEQIARYCDACGVAALIEDMRDAVKRYHSINTIVYFLHTRGGACRWEMLHMQQLEKQWQRDKKQHERDLEEMASILNLQDGLHQPPEPDWVAKARSQYRTLKKQRSSTRHKDKWPEIERDMAAIVQRLKGQGFLGKENL